VKRGLELRAGVTEQAVMLDIQAAADALPAGVKRGIVGYCWGGTIAWYGATRSSAFAAACGWYGGGIAATREEVPHCPVQLHFGEQDGGIPMTDVAAIREAQPGVQVFTYPDAGHGFGCEERGSLVEADARRAQERTLRFFAQHLG
jgi:carboxymethylenebutenolidase